MTGARVVGRLLAALGSALLLSGCGSGPEPGAPSVAPATPGVPRPSGDPTGPAKVACPPDGALIREIVVSAALGLRGMSLELVNCGSAPYRLDGPIDLGTTGRLGVSAWRPAERPTPTAPETGTPSGDPEAGTPPPDSRL